MNSADLANLGPGTIAVPTVEDREAPSEPLIAWLCENGLFTQD